VGQVTFDMCIAQRAPRAALRFHFHEIQLVIERCARMRAVLRAPSAAA
jgi:hypothetical protein